MTVADLITAPPLGAASSRAFPLGLSPHSDAADSVEADSVNVAVYAPDLDDVVLYFQAPGRDWRGVLLPDFTDGVHHGLVTGMPVGSRYGFLSAAAAAAAASATAASDGGRPTGGGNPGGGNPGVLDPDSVQLLLDPYGRAIHRRSVTNANGDASSAGAAGEAGSLYTSVRMDSGFDWGQDAHPHTPWRNTVLYEAHVKGQTMLHPGIPKEIRGSYAGMAHPAMIEYLTALGITAVELLPIQFHIDEPHLQDLDLTNYWGYNTLGFFVPQVSYASPAARAAGPQAVQDELKGMIKLLHAAGIEVILDVVYNHTAEGGQDRPALSWRGLADRQYYRNDGGRYVDSTGCGNSLDFSERRVVQLALDSLRYWVEEFHVDGFRFDLAVTLGRNADNDFQPGHPFLIAASTDRALAGIKLIAEPWDLGHDGWQTGRFPLGWADWNDRFRDSVRDVWLSDQAAIAAGGQGGPLDRLADGLAGSAELFAASGRSQLASLNFVTAHDGFTLRDLVSYNRKHNEANGEEDRDGHGHNRSWNHGVEGPTEDESIVAARAQTSRNIMATLLLSLGVPMITAGDELGRTQRGNNNAYCQDNELTWLDWSMDAGAQEMLAATRRLIQVRRNFLANQPSGYPGRGECSYLHWYNAEGRPMTPEQWRDPANRVLQLLIGSPDGLLDGLVVFNASAAPVDVTLPVLAADGGPSRRFERRMTTAPEHDERQGKMLTPGGRDRVAANAINIYRS